MMSSMHSLLLLSSLIITATKALHSQVNAKPCAFQGHNGGYLKSSRYIGAPISYYANTCSTFQVALLISGDVHPNPGPQKASESSSLSECVHSYNKSLPRISYDSSHLRQFMFSSLSPPQDVLNILRQLGISRKPFKKSHRGKRGGEEKAAINPCDNYFSS